MKIKGINSKKFNWLFYILGGLIFSIGLNCFIAPNNIAPGGASGLGIILNYLFKIPIGTATFIINIPLFIIGYFKLGRRDIVQSFYAMTIMSVLLDLSLPFLPKFSGDRMLASLYGGIITGLGLALVFMRGATTGGSDLAARIVQKKLVSFSIGRLLTFIDLTVILLSTIVFRDIESALYAAISIYVSAHVIDSILYGMGSGQLMFIITEKHADISEIILHQLRRGVTYIEAKGGFSGKTQNVLMCAVRKHEVFRLKLVINEIDPHAFIIVAEAGEITGEGFEKRV